MKTRYKIIIIGTFLPLLIMAGVFYGILLDGGHRVPYISLTHDYQLESNFNERLSQIEFGDTLKISDVTNFEWTSLYIVGPYSNFSPDAKNVDGIDFGELRHTGIMYSDGFAILAFIKDNKMIKFVEISRINNFCPYPIGCDPIKPILPEDAMFTVITDSDPNFRKFVKN